MPAEVFFKNFEAALSKLVEFKNLYDGSEIHRAGVIQAFEFTFEQGWKAIQKRAGQEGLTLASPKKALEWAMSNQWIASGNETIWLEMLSDRNLTSHTYREQTAKEIADRVIDTYVNEFVSLLSQMNA